MNNASGQIRLDFTRRTATLNGARLVLQEKAWAVLSILVSRAPGVVTRDTMIEEIWQGNFYTGDKGVNQALWAIRSALGDDAREPTYIKTLPRQGYQWIHKSPRARSAAVRNGAFSALVAGLGVLAIALPTRPGSDANKLPHCELGEQPQVQAYRVERNIFVDVHGGCRLILKPSGTKQFGDPLVSEDGERIAFTITEEQSCRLVTVGLRDGERSDFAECAPDISDYSSLSLSDGA